MTEVKSPPSSGERLSGKGGNKNYQERMASFQSMLRALEECEDFLKIQDQEIEGLSLCERMCRVHDRLEEIIKGIKTGTPVLKSCKLEEEISNYIDRREKKIEKAAAGGTVRAVLSAFGKTWNQLDAVKQKEIGNEICRNEISFDPDEV
jgi:hypothetical protein